MNFSIYQHQREIELSHELDIERSKNVIEIIVYPRTKLFQSPEINYQHIQQYVYFEYEGVVNFEKIRKIEFSLKYSWAQSNPLHIMSNNHRDSIVKHIHLTGINEHGYSINGELERDYSSLFNVLNTFEGLIIELKNLNSGPVGWVRYDYESIKELSSSIDRYKIRFILPLFSGAPVRKGFAPGVARSYDFNYTTYIFSEINFLVHY